MILGKTIAMYSLGGEDRAFLRMMLSRIRVSLRYRRRLTLGQVTSAALAFVIKTAVILAVGVALIAHSAGGQETTAKRVKRCVITDYGAVADVGTVNTRAIQATIDKCAGATGGVVVIPKQTFLSGSIFLK